MIIAPKHRWYLANKPFKFSCTRISQPQFRDEFELLKQYGSLLDALVSGEIVPLTHDEERIVQVDQGMIDPVTPVELAWDLLKEIRDYEQSMSNVPHYRVFDRAADWFPINSWWGAGYPDEKEPDHLSRPRP